jgi:hypothetical protein
MAMGDPKRTTPRQGVETMPDFASSVLLGRPRHVRRLSLGQLEALAVETEQFGAKVQQVGVVVVQRLAGEGRETPRLFVMTEKAWRRLSGDPAINPPELEAEATSQPYCPAFLWGVVREPVARPTPEAVVEAVRVLRQTGERVLVPTLVRALCDQTGCSRAGAYRAIADAFAAGVIR